MRLPENPRINVRTSINLDAVRNLELHDDEELEFNSTTIVYRRRREKRTVVLTTRYYYYDTAEDVLRAFREVSEKLLDLMEHYGVKKFSLRPSRQRDITIQHESGKRFRGFFAHNQVVMSSENYSATFVFEKDVKIEDFFETLKKYVP